MTINYRDIIPMLVERVKESVVLCAPKLKIFASNCKDASIAGHGQRANGTDLAQSSGKHNFL